MLGASIVLLVALAVVGLRGQSRAGGLQGADALARIYGDILNGDFDTAAGALASCTGIPREACLVLDANRIWWRIQLDPYETSLDAAFTDTVEQAIARSEAWVEREPARAEAWFYLGGAYGARAQWRVLREERLAAARDGKRIKQSLERALELEPTLEDAQFGIGLYQYYADIAPAVAKFLRVLLLLPGGDREEGLRRMLRARDAGKLMRGEADFQLHVIYLWYERDFRKALDYLRGLDRAHPRNPLFLQSIAEIADAYVHDRTESLLQWRALLGRVTRRQVHEARIAEVRARLGIAAQLDALEQTDLAIDELTTVVSMGATPPYATAAIASWHLARAFDRLGRRDEAARAYAAALARVPRNDVTGLSAPIRASQAAREDATTAAVRRASIEGFRLYERQQHDAARAMLDRALAIRPADVVTLHRRGLVARALKDAARATSAFDRACASPPGEHPTFVADACMARGDIAAEAHDVRLASAMYERAASIFGAHAVRRAEASRRARAVRGAATR